MVRWRLAAVELLRLPDYRNFWLSLACGAIARNFWYTAAFWFVLERSDSQLWVGLVGGGGVVPTIAFSLHGGAIADQYRPQTCLADSKGRVRVACGDNGLAGDTSDIVKPWHLVLVSLAVGTVGALGGPASRTLVVDLVGKRRLFGANALRLTAESASEIFGPLVVGIVIAASGVAPVSYAVVGTFLVSLALMLRVRPSDRKQMPEQGSILEDIWAGLAYALRTPPIPALLLIVIAEMPGGVIITHIPVYARDVLEVGPIGFGVLSASLGAGFLAGSMVATAVGGFPRKGLVLLVTAAMWDVSKATFAFSRVYPLSAALLFIMGVGGAIHVNLLITMLQTRASDEMRGRVMSIYSLALASLPLGFILGGALAALVSNEFALVVSGLLSTPLIIVVYLRSAHLRQA